MKCEKCGNAEAGFHYRAVINGDVTERHLCSDCAGEEGLIQMVNWSPLLPDMFGFAGMFNFGGGYGRRRMESMFGGSRMMPSLEGVVTTEDVKPEASEASIPADAGIEMRVRREISVLRHRLHTAVHEEEFEEAAELRDKIRELENSVREKI